MADDELPIFAGHTRFVSVKKSATPRHPLDVADPRTYGTPHSSQSRQSTIDASTSTSYRTTFETTPQPPQQVLSVPAMNNWLPPVEDVRQNGDFMSLPRSDLSPSGSYPYALSAHTHQTELSTPYGWSSQSPQEPVPSETLLPQLHHYPDTRSANDSASAVPRQLGHAHYESHLQGPTTPLHHRYLQHSIPPIQHHRRNQSQSQGQGQSRDDYTTASMFNPELVDLGLTTSVTSRDSRPDERWSSLMQDSEGYGR